MWLADPLAVGQRHRCLAFRHPVAHIVEMSSTSRIVINPEVCGGRPIIAGTRLRVADILDMLAGGTSESEVLADFPFLCAEDVRASLSYAARAIDHSVVLAA